MGLQIDLDRAAPGLPSPVRRPGPVHRLRGTVRAENFWLEWQSPRGGGPVSRYRVERTRDGRGYETVLETCCRSCVIRAVPPGDPWFYRVTAINPVGGAGRARKAIFYQRGGAGFEEMVLPIPVAPGLRVGIYTLEDAAPAASPIRQPPSRRARSVGNA